MSKKTNLDSILGRVGKILKGENPDAAPPLKDLLKAEDKKREKAKATREKKREESKKKVIAAMTHNEIVSACHLWLKTNRPDVIKHANGIRFNVDNGTFSLTAEIWEKKDDG